MSFALKETHDRDSGAERELLCEQRRLVVASLKETPPVERNGNDGVVMRRRFIEESRREPTQRSCKFGASPVLEKVNAIPDFVGVFEKSIRPDPRRLRRIHAVRAGIEDAVDFRSAGPAGFPPDHRHPRKAGGTEHVRFAVERNAAAAERTGHRQNRGDPDGNLSGESPQNRRNGTHLLLRTSAI